jgi:hypothetical protein
VLNLDGGDRGQGPARLLRDEVCKTSPSGAFRIEGCGRSRYLLRARAADDEMALASAAVVVDTSAVAGDVVLHLAPTTQVPLDYRGRGHGFLFADIVDAHELPVWCGLIVPGLQIVELLPGAYRLRLAEDAAKSRSVYPFQVTAHAQRLVVPGVETDTGCQLEAIESAASIERAPADPGGRLGTILHGEIRGPWPPGATPALEVLAMCGTQRLTSRIAPPSYALPGLRAGSWRLTLRGPHGSVEVPVELPAGQTFARLDLDLSPGAPAPSLAPEAR